MYKKSVQGWLKHLDFMILDVVCLWISFTLAFGMRHGSLNVFANSLYRDMMWSLALMDIVVIFFFDSLKNVLKRGFYHEFTVTVKQTCLITLCSVFYLFTFKEAADYSRLVLTYTAALYLLLSYITRNIWKYLLRKYLGGNGRRSLLIVTVSEIVDTVIDNIIRSCNAYLIDADHSFLAETFASRLNTIDGLSDQEKADYKAKVDGNDADSENEMTPEDQKSALITRGLGGKKNISDVDCCATRLRCTVVKPELVNEDVLRMTSPSGIVRKGQGIQVIYGPAVSVIKSNLEDYLEKAPNVEYLPEENENSAEETNKCAETKDEAKKDENKTVAAGTVKKELCSPFTGVAAPIEEACDEAFAGKMMGDGYLVRPEEGMAYAPEDATVSFIFPSKHAVGLTSDDGTEYLLHIGVDTVNLDGKGFETFVNDGDRVKKGDKLIGFDIKYIQEHAKSDECMVVFTSLQEGEEIRMSKSGKVEKLEKTAEIVSLN